jgi:hypothetical protein
MSATTGEREPKKMKTEEENKEQKYDDKDKKEEDEQYSLYKFFQELHQAQNDVRKILIKDLFLFLI